MRIDSSRGAAVAPEFRARRDREHPPQTAERIPPGRSLVPLKNVVTGEHRPIRALATFVTQLIAREQHAAPTRVRNRAEPAEAAQAYRRMLNLSGTPKRYKARPF